MTDDKDVRKQEALWTVIGTVVPLALLTLYAFGKVGRWVWVFLLGWLLLSLVLGVRRRSPRA